MAQLPDELVQQLLENIETTGTVFAKARRRQEECKERRKITKAQVMKVLEASGVRSVNQQERDTYAHPTYEKAVEDWMNAIQDETLAEVRFRNAEREWESWRTICANERTAGRA